MPGGERHVDDEAALERTVQDLEQPIQFAWIQPAITPHQLRTFGRVRPDADAVESCLFQKLKIADDICPAHHTEVRDERQEARRSVDREPIAGDRQSLTERFARRERKERNDRE